VKRRLILTILMLPGSLVRAQGPAAAPPPQAARPAAAAPAALPPPARFGNVVVKASIRSRVEAWDWFTPASGEDQYAFSGNILRFGFSQNRERWDWDVEFGVPFLLGLPGDLVAPGVQGGLGLGANYLVANDRNQNAAMIFPKQFYVRITQFGGSRAHQLKLGRFEFLDGSELTPRNAALPSVKSARVNQRLLGNFGWTHVGRSFDGVHYAYNKPWGNFTFVGAVPTRGVFQTDGWGWNKVAFGYAALTKPWGSGGHSAETRFLGLVYNDWRQVLKTDSRSLAARRADTGNIKIGTFGGHSLHAFTTGAGTVDLLVWGAAQMGAWGIQKHRAYAVDFEAGIQPKIWPKLKPWLRGGFYRGSGDNTAGDAIHGTFFQMLPTPRPFAKTPFFNMMNNQECFGILTLRPHSKLTVISEYHALRLTVGNDLWYSGGGAFQPWSFGYVGRATGGARSLANLYDVAAELRLNPHLTLAPYFGFAQGRAVMAAIYPQGANAAFGYIEVNYNF
jgi:hypothetical protein